MSFRIFKSGKQSGPSVVGAQSNRARLPVARPDQLSGATPPAGIFGRFKRLIAPTPRAQPQGPAALMSTPVPRVEQLLKRVSSLDDLRQVVRKRIGRQEGTVLTQGPQHFDIADALEAMTYFRDFKKRTHPAARQAFAQIPDGMLRDTMVRVMRTRMNTLHDNLGMAFQRSIPAEQMPSEMVFDEWFVMESICCHARDKLSLTEVKMLEVREALYEIEVSEDRPRQMLERVLEVLEAYPASDLLQQVAQTLDAYWDQLDQLEASAVIKSHCLDKLGADLGLLDVIDGITIRAEERVKQKAEVSPVDFWDEGLCKTSALPWVDSVSTRTLDPGELRDLQQRALTSVAQEVMSDPLLRPQTKVKLDGMMLYLSQMVESSSGRKYVVALNDATEPVEAFFYYASKSGGSWRYASHTYGSLIAKDWRHYTAGNRLVDELLQYLQSWEDLTTSIDGERIIGLFQRGEMGSKTQAVLSASEGQIEYYEHPDLAAVQDFQPGSMFKGGDHGKVPTLKMLNEAIGKLPKDFIPEFAWKPIKSMRYDHQQLGPSMKLTYSSTLDGREVYWELGVSLQDGGAWVEAIRFADATRLPDGRYTPLLDTGFLTSKPLEYISQLVGAFGAPELAELIEKQPYGSYADIRSIIARLGFMEDFYQSRTYRGKIQPHLLKH